MTYIHFTIIYRSPSSERVSSSSLVTSAVCQIFTFLWVGDWLCARVRRRLLADGEQSAHGSPHIRTPPSNQPKNNQITGQQQQQTNITNQKNQPKKENLACLNVYISGEKFQTSKFHEKTCQVDFAIPLKGDKISIASEISLQALIFRLLSFMTSFIYVKLFWKV